MFLGIMAALAVVMIVICIVWIRDINRFAVVSYELFSSKLKKDITAVMLSDLHDKEFGHKNEKLLEEIRRVKPDMIWIAGDMFTSNNKVDSSVAERLVKELCKLAKVYYANGNHEQKIKRNREAYMHMYEDYKTAIADENLCMLENESVYLPEYNINVSGIEIEKKYFTRMKKQDMNSQYVESTLGKSRQDAFQILIAHNPIYFDNYAEWGADLTLSGHVHGGVMRLPFLGGVISPSYEIFPKYDGGLFQKNGKHMILGRGLGTHTIPIRIWNPGELVVVRLKAEKNSKEEG